jgi:hypothetical protein
MPSDTDDLTADDSSPESMPRHREDWKQHDLLATILRRYFYVASHMSGGFLPTWVVSPKEGKDVNESLAEANRYFQKLGWAAKISRTDEWIIQMIPLPERPFPSSKLTLMMWSVSALTLTLAGAYWMEGSRPTGGWFFESSFLDVLIGYTLPVLVCIFIASLIQKRTASHFNHRVGHITPIPEPTIALWSLGLFSQTALIWPFGLFLIPTLPRMDARLWEDRKVLGWVAISVPASLISLGLALWAIGLWLTPDYVEITQAHLSLRYWASGCLMIISLASSGLIHLSKLVLFSPSSDGFLCFQFLHSLAVELWSHVQDTWRLVVVQIKCFCSSSFLLLLGYSTPSMVLQFGFSS